MDARAWRIAAVIGAGLMVVGLLGFVARPDDTDRSAAAGAETGDRSELDLFVDEAIGFIEVERELTFLTRPTVLVVPDDEFVALLDEDFAETFDDDPEFVEQYTTIYRALGLIDPDESIDEEYRAFGSAGVLGFYDTETEELVVREGDGLSLLTRATIVHELVHALEDQRFELFRPEYDDRTDELPWTFSAVVEGSASHIESQWVSALSADDQQALELEELSFGDDSMFDEFSIAFLVSELAVYWDGEEFVAAVIADEGMEAIDGLLVEPPATSEQVLRPELWPDEAPLEVAVPSVDGDLVYEGAGGQALIEALLTEIAPPGDIERVANGWGGDTFVAYRDEGRSCLRWDLRADSPTDLDELEAGLGQWVDTFGGSVSQPAGDLLRVDRCV